MKRESFNFSAAGKGKMWEAEDGGGMDEQLEVLGYKVRSSDMVEVAQKLEQLEVLGYKVRSSDYDLKAIPGKAIYGQSQSQSQSQSQTDSSSSRDAKRLKISSGSNPIGPHAISAESTRPVVLVDSQENGVRLVHALMASAEAVRQNNLAVAISQAGAMRKVATYFAEALARRIYTLPAKPPQPRRLRHHPDPLLRELAAPEIRAFHGQPGHPRGLRGQETRPRFQHQPRLSVAGAQ